MAGLSMRWKPSQTPFYTVVIATCLPHEDHQVLRSTRAVVNEVISIDDNDHDDGDDDDD